MCKRKYIVISLIAFALIVLLKPLGISTNQGIILGSLVSAVILWASSGLNRNLVSGLLLASFIIFSKTPAKDVISFAYSDTFFLIITTTLLSVGMINSGAVNGIVSSIFYRSAKTINMVLFVPYLLGIVLVFIIPQAFARVIIMGSIYSSLITHNNQDQLKAKQVILFNLFFAITVTYMMFLNGDIVLNGAALSFSTASVQGDLTSLEWFKFMALPTAFVSVISMYLIKFIFRKELAHFDESMVRNTDLAEEKNSRKLTVILIMFIIILLWIFEGVHGIKPWIFSTFGVVIMFLMGALKKSDLKSVNLGFLLFLVSAFSIGKVLGNEGITEIFFQQLSTVLSSPESPIYFLLLMIVVLVLHLCIGSSVATMSVVLPILVPMVENAQINGIVITLITYIAVNLHFMLPFHHATMMIGAGKEYYPDSFMTRMGSFMFIAVIIMVFALYFPWWKIMGLL